MPDPLQEQRRLLHILRRTTFASGNNASQAFTIIAQVWGVIVPVDAVVRNAAGDPVTEAAFDILVPANTDVKISDQVLDTNDNARYRIVKKSKFLGRNATMNLTGVADVTK